MNQVLIPIDGGMLHGRYKVEKESLSGWEMGEGKIGRVMSLIVGQVLCLVIDQIQSKVIEVNMIIPNSIVDLLII